MNPSIEPDRMYWTIMMENDKPMYIPLCGSCLLDEHKSFGVDHRNGVPDRQDCKTVDEQNAYQCLCNPEWTDLYEKIQKKELPIFKTQQAAKDFQLEEIIVK